MNQACSRVAMVRPHHFRSNEQTAADNRFQRLDPERIDAAVSRYAREEFDAMVAQLNQQGIRVEVFEDTTTDTPDSVFPNNWSRVSCNFLRYRSSGFLYFKIACKSPIRSRNPGGRVDSFR